MSHSPSSNHEAWAHDRWDPISTAPRSDLCASAPQIRGRTAAGRIVEPMSFADGANSAPPLQSGWFIPCPGGSRQVVPVEWQPLAATYTVAPPARPYLVVPAELIEIAEAKVGIPGWKGYRWESMEGGHVVRGCVPHGLYTRGRHQGRPRFSHPLATDRRAVIITEAEVFAAATAYETQTGNCWDCKGSGQNSRAWTPSDGQKLAPCKRCKGSGEPTPLNVQPDPNVAANR